MCMVLYYFVRSATDRKKRPFFLAIGYAEVRPYYITIVYDIVKFQIDLVILASSKNFGNRLHN